MRELNLVFQVVNLVLFIVSMISVLGIIFGSVGGIVWYLVLRGEMDLEKKKKDSRIATWLIFAPILSFVCCVVLYFIVTVVKIALMNR
jgi:phosphate/sulfate permease